MPTSFIRLENAEGKNLITVTQENSWQSFKMKPFSINTEMKSNTYIKLYKLLYFIILYNTVLYKLLYLY